MLITPNLTPAHALAPGDFIIEVHPQGFWMHIQRIDRIRPDYDGYAITVDEVTLFADGDRDTDRMTYEIWDGDSTFKVIQGQGLGTAI